MFRQRGFLFGLLPVQLGNMRRQIRIAILARGKLAATTLFGVESIHLLLRLVAFIRELLQRLHGGIILGLNVLVQIGFCRRNFNSQFLEFNGILLLRFRSKLDRLLQFLALQLQFRALRNSLELIRLGILPLQSIAPQGIRFGAHLRLGRSNPIVRLPRRLVQFAQSFGSRGADAFNAIECVTGLLELHIVERVFHGAAFAIERLIVRQFFLFAAQFVEAGFNGFQHIFNFVNGRLVFFHFGERFGLLFIIDSGASHFFEQSKAFSIVHGTERIDFSLLNNVVRI
mmetsp:Transcript_9463/g.15731  ORF Transcript_9463/g.15731 Transcript_9463/m.15731 type:complete len:285 (-) Transcript_9463:438-1292(-)